MVAFNKFYSFSEALAEGTHDLGSDNLKVILTNTAPTAGNSALGDLTEIAAGNGYTAGGELVTITSSSQTNGLYKLIGSDITITAVAGSIGPFRYAALYNDTDAGKGVVGYWDQGSAETLAADESITLDFDDTEGILQVS